MQSIRVENLCKDFEYYKKGQGIKGSLKNMFHRELLQKRAVDSISFSVDSGEMVGFLGPNGAGKTTTLKMLSGILYPSSGDIDVMGFVPAERKNEFKRMISIVMGQKNQLWWDLPAIDSMELAKKIYEIDDSLYNKRLDEMTTLLGVKELMNVQVRRLSLGERMKMELIAALIHHPKVLYLDEPTIGLDIISQKNIRAFLKEYNQSEGVTVLLTSHYMDDINELCDRSIVINHGEIVYDNPTKEIRKLISGNKIVTLKFRENTNVDLSRYGKIREKKENEVAIEVSQDRTNEMIKSVLNQYELIDFSVEDLPIEEGVELLYNM